MHFQFVDRVLERTESSIVTVKAVTLAEEYLQDHFAGFEVLPGVFMLESLVQAARALISHEDESRARWVLGEAKAFRYGSFVRPGETLRCEVELIKSSDESATFKGTASVRDADESRQCCTGRFALRPLRPLAHPAAVHSRA